jgi:hypothetical protein
MEDLFSEPPGKRRGERQGLTGREKRDGGEDEDEEEDEDG